MDAGLKKQLAWLTKVPSSLRGMKRGLEKEALRVDPEGWLAQSPHPAALGSALTHPNITTDYSEALIELITPPCDSVASALGYLDELHRYVYAHIGSERLWVNSMPCKLGADEQIPLAQYGRSNIGRMKTLYRHGLGLRYGRRMQTIAGIHYNVSFPDEFWQHFQQAENNQDSLQSFKSARSMDLIRNFQRNSWFLLYVLGASPAVCGTFLEGRDHQLMQLPSGALYMPGATSLRMSSLGYQNDAQSDLRVCANSLQQYIGDLDRAIRTPYPPYTAIGVKQDDQFIQINDSILQIENEFYGLIRPKSVAGHGERPTQALGARGVEYIELRCVDLDPFEPLGISRDTAHFLEVFALHCLLRDSQLFDAEGLARLPRNQQAMVERGRDPALLLEDVGGSRYFKDMASQLLAEFISVADVLDSAHQTQAYSAAVAQQIMKLKEPALTGSAMVLAAMHEDQDCYFNFAMACANKTREHFTARPLSEERMSAMIRTAQSSLAALHKLEDEPEQNTDFAEFINNYFNQPLVYQH